VDLCSRLGDTDFVRWVVLGTGIAGLVAGAATLRFAKDGTSKPWRLVRCFAGFICSMVWIAAIADEVVSVLQVSCAAGRVQRG
jgi:sodium/potassium/calcium exchanger 6